MLHKGPISNHRAAVTFHIDTQDGGQFVFDIPVVHTALLRFERIQK
jgi:hypothetical protein